MKLEVKGKYADTVFIDDDDYEKIKHYNWYISDKGYVVATTKERTKIRLQRIIMNAPDGLLVDHINGNRLDNRKENLRICTYGENTRNRKSQGKTSKYKGVSFRSNRGTWRACLISKGVTYLDKSFKDELEAAHAYDKVAKAIYGEYAKLNFPANT